MISELPKTVRFPYDGVPAHANVPELAKEVELCQKLQRRKVLSSAWLRPKNRREQFCEKRKNDPRS